MKKVIFCLCLFSLFAISSCNKNNSVKSLDEIQKSENEFDSKIQNTDSIETVPKNKENLQKKSSKKLKIDFDFTKMNYNIASGILFDMIVESEKYENKNVKVKGEFISEMHDENRLYAVLIWDVTGCCPTGIGFIPPENMKFPEDFPQLNSEITIEGTMKKAKVGENESLYLFVEDLRSET